jgi:hypothetical protein
MTVFTPARFNGWDAWYQVERYTPIVGWRPIRLFHHRFGTTRIRVRSLAMEEVRQGNYQNPNHYRLVHCEISFQSKDPPSL